MSCLMILTPLWNCHCVWRDVFSVTISGGLLDPPGHWMRGALSSALTSLPSVADSEPTQVGRLRLTAKEKQDLLARGLCLCCGKPGH